MGKIEKKFPKDVVVRSWPPCDFYSDGSQKWLLDINRVVLKFIYLSFIALLSRLFIEKALVIQGFEGGIDIVTI